MQKSKTTRNQKNWFSLVETIFVFWNDELWIYFLEVGRKNKLSVVRRAWKTLIMIYKWKQLVEGLCVYMESKIENSFLLVNFSHGHLSHWWE